MNERTTCYFTKKEVLKAYQTVSIEDIITFILPTEPSIRYQTAYCNFIDDCSKKYKENLWILTVYIRTLYQYFMCLWHPFRMPMESLDDVSFGEILKEFYKEGSKKEGLPNQTELNNTKFIYGYYIGKVFIECVDNIYGEITSKEFPTMSLPESKVRNMRLWLRFNNLSMRGNHRVKLWDTFVIPMSRESRRAFSFKFVNLPPEDKHYIDFIDNETAENQVSNLFGSAAHMDAVHPHISSGDACWGAWSNRIQRAANAGFADAYLKSIRRFLCTWTPSSPFWRINDRFRQTFKFLPIKRRKLCHWGVVDTEYLSRQHPSGSNWHNINRERKWVIKILANEKHIKGFYTDSFMRRLAGFESEISTTQGRFTKQLNSLRKLINNNAWDWLYELEQMGWHHNNVSLYNCDGKFISVLDKFKWLIREIKSQYSYLILEKLDAVEYEDVEEVLRNGVSTMYDSITLEELQEVNAMRYCKSTTSPHLAKWADDMIVYLKSPDELNKEITNLALDVWRREHKINRLRKEEIDLEIIHLEKNTKQSELLFKPVSV